MPMCESCGMMSVFNRRDTLLVDISKIAFYGPPKPLESGCPPAAARPIPGHSIERDRQLLVFLRILWLWRHGSPLILLLDLFALARVELLLLLDVLLL